MLFSFDDSVCFKGNWIFVDTLRLLAVWFGGTGKDMEDSGWRQFYLIGVIIAQENVKNPEDLGMSTVSFVETSISVY